MYIMYTNALNNITRSYTYVSSYMKWRVHPLGFRCFEFFANYTRYLCLLPYGITMVNFL